MWKKRWSGTQQTAYIHVNGSHLLHLIFLVRRFLLNSSLTEACGATSHTNTNDQNFSIASDQFSIQIFSLSLSLSFLPAPIRYTYSDKLSNIQFFKRPKQKRGYKNSNNNNKIVDFYRVSERTNEHLSAVCVCVCVCLEILWKR